MTFDVQAMVREFHEVKGAAIAAPIGEWVASRTALFAEESAELVEALGGHDPVAVMHEAADVVYVAYGHAVALGYDLTPVIAEVHRANMSKASDSDGTLSHKGHKGAGFRKADVAAVLREQDDARCAGGEDCDSSGSRRGRRRHLVKCWPEYFDAMAAGVKTFDVRYDDRHYQVGDLIIQRRWNRVTQTDDGDTLGQEITYILRDAEQFGVAEGYVVLGVIPAAESYR